MRLPFFILLLVILSVAESNSYTAYKLGKWTYPGCDARYGGNTCVVTIQLPGPPEQGAPPVLVNVDTSTITQVNGVVKVALPTDPYQLNWWNSAVITGVWFTTDGSPCPIPN